jgi:hypothetical protein
MIITVLGPVCLGCGWLAAWGKLLCRESCCAEKAAVLSLTVWLLDWLASCMLRNCLKYPHSSENMYNRRLKCIIVLTAKYYEYTQINKKIKTPKIDLSV